MILALVTMLALPPIPASGMAATHLVRCPDDDDRSLNRAYCGTIRVPLDWTDANSGTIKIGFEFLPADIAGSTRTIVAQAGGPGGASINDGFAVRRVFGPVLATHNLLLMDERGTGSSTAINCRGLQSPLDIVPGIGDYNAQVLSCGRYLNHHFRTRNGRSFVHASDLFSTQQSVQDLAAIVRVLHLRPIDLFGYSYGTFFAQYFAWHFPSLVHSLILDSAYPLDQDFFDAPQRREIRSALDTVCARSIACAATAPGPSSERIRRLSQRLAQSPIKTRSGDIDDSDLESLLMSAGVDRPSYEFRDLDGAARAWLDHADLVPLRRLFDWANAGSGDETAYTSFSKGMQFADTCTMYSTSFDMRASLRERLRQYRRSVDRLPTSFFYPSDKALANNGNSYFNMCLRWPKPSHAVPSMGSTAGLPPRLPTLMLSGDIDITTPPGDAELARRWLGKSVRFVTIPNGQHVSSFHDAYFCADRIVRSFAMNPDGKLDTSCLTSIPEVRTVGVFPKTLSDQAPADGRFGDQATPNEARLSAIAVGAVGDAIESARLAVENDTECADYQVCGRGLRGGRFRTTFRAQDIQLNEYAYASDSGVSGDITITRTRTFPGAGVVVALIHVRMFDGSAAEQLTVVYDERKPHAVATIDGYARSGHAIHESVPAP